MRTGLNVFGSLHRMRLSERNFCGDWADLSFGSTVSAVIRLALEVDGPASARIHITAS